MVTQPISKRRQREHIPMVGAARAGKLAIAGFCEATKHIPMKQNIRLRLLVKTADAVYSTKRRFLPDGQPG